MSSKINSYTEIYELLEIMGDNYKNKLPVKVYNFFKENKLEMYNKEKIISKIRRKELSKEALNIFSLLYLKYFYENDLEKDILKQIYGKNNKEYKDIINEEKDYQIFNNSKDNLEPNNQIIEIPKENIIRKILKWVKNIFIRKNK